MPFDRGMFQLLLYVCLAANKNMIQMNVLKWKVAHGICDGHFYVNLSGTLSGQINIVLEYVLRLFSDEVLI